MDKIGSTESKAGSSSRREKTQVGRAHPKHPIRRIACLIPPELLDPVILAMQIGDVLTRLQRAVSVDGCEIEPIQIRTGRHPGLLDWSFGTWFGVKGSQEGVWRPNPEENAMSFVAARVQSQFGDHFEGRLKILPLRVFEWKTERDSALSDYLSCFAQLHHFDLIVAYGNVIPKPLQIFRKKFVSVLLERSRVPVMLFDEGLQASAVSRLRHILFLMPEPELAFEGFRNVVELARASGARITLLPMFHSGGGKGVWVPELEQFGAVQFVTPNDMVAAAERRRLVVGWTNEARRAGTLVRIRADGPALGLKAAMRASLAEDGCDVIAVDPGVPSSYGWLDDAPLGCPVWSARPLGQSQILDEVASLERSLMPA